MTKTWFKRALMSSGLLRLTAARNAAVVLMYHSVMDDPGQHSHTLGEIVLPTRVFRQQMETLARHYHPVSMDDVLQHARGKKELPPRSVAVTFDDGYADNLEVAGPILAQFSVPATVYVTVDCVENSKLPWPARLRRAFLTSKKSPWLQPGGQSLPLSNVEMKTAAFSNACELAARLAGAPQETFVASVERDLEVGSCAGDLMMTWDQVRAWARQGNIIGSHTCTHPNLAYVGESDARDELGASKTKLEQELKGIVAHFAYPGPALRPIWSAESLRMSREIGYETAVTTTSGAVRPGDDPLCLRRAGPTQSVDGLRWNLERAFAGRAS